MASRSPRALSCLFFLALVAGCSDASATPESVMCDPGAAESVRIAYVDPGVTPVACDHFTEAGPRDVVVRRATVVSATDDASGAHLALDFCSPAADCIAITARSSTTPPPTRRSSAARATTRARSRGRCASGRRRATDRSRPPIGVR
jgi:hypothetical protein